jgi:hypothetical protein
LKPEPAPVVVVPLTVAPALVIVKVTLGTNAPAVSFTEPSMLPVVSCPRESEHAVRTIVAIRKVLRGFNLCMGRLLIEITTQSWDTKGDLDHQEAPPGNDRRYDWIKRTFASVIPELFLNGVERTERLDLIGGVIVRSHANNKT